MASESRSDGTKARRGEDSTKRCEVRRAFLLSRALPCSTRLFGFGSDYADWLEGSKEDPRSVSDRIGNRSTAHARSLSGSSAQPRRRRSCTGADVGRSVGRPAEHPLRSRQLRLVLGQRSLFIRRSRRGRNPATFDSVRTGTTEKEGERGKTNGLPLFSSTPRAPARARASWPL